MSFKKLKICHVITRMIIGGAQENTLLTCLEHIKKGHDVTLVTGPSEGREGELLDSLNITNKDLKIIETPLLVRELKIKTDVKAYFYLRKYFLDEQFDVVHTHASKAGIIGRIAARDAKTPVVVHTVHGQAFHLKEKPWKNAIYKLSEKIAAYYCDKIFAVAQAMIDQCVAAKIAPRNKYKVVYSGMKIQQFLNATYDDALAEDLEIPKDKIIIGSLARLFEFKGYEYFIPAALEIAEKFENVDFLIVGDGNMYPDILEKINATKYAKRFHFAGLVSPDKVYKYLSLMDILWHFSVREGLPRSVVQAMATKVVPMGFNLDGTPEVILNHKSGILLDYQDIFEENLFNIIYESQFLIEGKSLRERLADYAQNLVKEKFDYHHMADILEEEYLKLMINKTK